MAIPLEELFDPAFLESLQHLRLIARRVPPGGRFAEHLSRDLGPGIEFRDFRPYVPGDDLRAVDWNIYRRLGRVFVRLYEELEDLPLYLLPDISLSTVLEDPPRLHAGLRCALALASISLGQHDSVGILPFSEDLSVLVRPASGADRVMTLAKRMTEIEPGGQTDLVQSLRRLASLRFRPGLLVILSDFFDPAGIEVVLAELGRVRHRLLLVQLIKEADRDPGLQGDLRLRDCETGAVEEVSMTSSVLEGYRAAHDRFESALVGFARRRNAGLLRLDVDRPVVPQLATLFDRGHLLV